MPILPSDHDLVNVETRSPRAFSWRRSSATAPLAVYLMTLASPPPIVLVDGMWIKIAYPTGECRLDAQGRRRAVKRKQKRVVLSALGVWPDGHWEIVHWKVAEGERADTWKAFFGESPLKGVTEATTDLVVSDGANGLESALDYHLYGVAHQRCIFHKIKQLADHLVLGAESGAQWVTQSKRRVRPSGSVKKRCWSRPVGSMTGRARRRCGSEPRCSGRRGPIRGPDAVANFLVDFDKTFAYLSIVLSEPFRGLIRTTNLLERFHKEMRRKQRDIGMLQSEQGCETLWYLLSRRRETAKQRAMLQSRV